MVEEEEEEEEEVAEEVEYRGGLREERMRHNL